MKIFISHATEDNKVIAAPLAQELIKSNYNVWYDQYTLFAGDSLRENIDKGLAECDFGIVIFSHSFFKKKWTMLELNGLISKEIAFNQKFIIPIWHKLEQKDVAKYSPMLADIVAIKSSEDLSEIVRKIETIVIRTEYNIDAIRAECLKMSTFFYRYFHTIWCGAIQLTPNLVLAFGNDGYTNKNEKETKSHKIVERFRYELKAHSIRELGFGVDSNLYSWTMMIESKKAQIIHNLLWDCTGYNDMQRHKAQVGLLSMGTPLYNSDYIYRK